jgi:hypothetical protein
MATEQEILDRTVTLPGYRAQQRRIRRMRRQLADHPDGLDPDHPEFTEDDVRQLELEAEDL